MKSNIKVFRSRFYGDYKCSGSGEVLRGLCYCVAEEDDDDGLRWRSFTPEFWKDNIESILSPAEVYEMFPAAEYNERI